ncbi:cytoskeleton-associated protein 2 [Boleophthalmus pectinirostris]|uniref:cytoskeleton-associated protein 2 n=1 Tax=Boleophthalmus pectinirostris TaxID=150288 RepID=UPI00242B1A25|nr:cytoskeleton-associated protein 2 [Boleophthalmus pectinirostris]
MDSTTVSRQNNPIKKRNKENVQPVPVVKSFIKQNILQSSAPLQTNGYKKDHLGKTAKEAPAKQTERRQIIGVGKTATLKNPAPARKPTLSQECKNEQAAKIKKLVGEAPKPATSQPPKPAFGMYKGKIIESKIGSIWKSSAPAKSEDQKSTAPKTTHQKSGNPTTATGRGSNTSASNRSVKPNTSSSRPPNAFSSARPPTRSVPTAALPRNATVAQSRRCGTLIAKPKVPVTDKKASKPPVTSTVSQYRRTNSETAEEKKAKLAEWLALKGKTLKRPAMTSTAPSTKNKTSNKSAAPPSKSQLTTKSNSEPEVKEEPKPVSVTPVLPEDNPEVDNLEVDNPDKRTSLIMNTTLDLLENSDLDLPVDPQDGGSDEVDNIVVNLCDALEALAPPSHCDDEVPVVNKCNDMDNEAKTECVQEEVKMETPNKMMVKSEGSESDEESEESDDDDCYVKENTPPKEEASVVKYSVKTTPFLQSVKKTIEDEVCSSTSKRKSNIKDLKFLTPVRRSSRIHRQSSRLPNMLVDHDPCVSSLAELVKLDDDPNAYIYRKNPALLDDLPDQPSL